MLEAIQKSAELASKMLRQQHFLYQRKNLYIPILGRIFSSEPDSEDTPGEFPAAGVFCCPGAPYFILGNVLESKMQHYLMYLYMRYRFPLYNK